MHATRLFARLLVVCLLCTLLLPAPQPGAAQTGPDPQPTPETIPTGLSAEEWQSVQAQISAAEASPLSPTYEPASGRQPVYLVAPITRVAASDGGSYDEFGVSVDIDGEQMIVGAEYYQEGAYLFQRSRDGADQWGQTKKIIATDGAEYDRFGGSVAISGDIVVVGAPDKDGTNSYSGAAYVFYRNQGGLNNWGQVKKLTGSGQASAHFGESVDISDDTIVVGEPGYSLGGQAYVFQRNQGGVNNWGQVQVIWGLDTDAGDQFGADVAIDNDLIAVGAPYNDPSGAANGGTVYMFYHDSAAPNEWSQLDMLDGGYVYAGDHFGASVALDNGLLVVGAPDKEVAGSSSSGAAFVFTQIYYTDEWLEQAMLFPPAGTDDAKFGIDVAISGQFIVVGAYYQDVGSNVVQGAAYVFQRSRGGVDNWGLLQEINAINGAVSDRFGTAVAISNDRIVVGASQDDVAGYPDRGSAHVFAIQAQDWYIHTSLVADASQHQTLDVDGDWMAVGLPYMTVGGRAYNGAVNLYRRQLASWQFVKQITLSDGAAYDEFGFSVALDGDLLAVGAPGWEGGNSNQGIVMLYKRNQGGIDNWGEWSNASMGGENDLNFGYSVAVHGDLLVIGVPWDNVGANTDQGSVWVAHLAPTGWGWRNIPAPDAAANNFYGYAVSLDNDILAVSNHNSAAEAVYVHYRNQGGADMWGMAQKLTSSGSEGFGVSLSVSDELLAVGSPAYDSGSITDQGRVKIFSKNTGAADSWGLLKTITNATGLNNDGFGAMVALEYDRLLVSAPGADSDGDNYVSAYRRNHAGINEWGRFDRIMVPPGSQANYGLAMDGETAAFADPAGSIQVLYFQANYWMLQGTAVAQESTSGNLFMGTSVAIRNNQLVVGATGENGSQGAAYLFERNRYAPEGWALVKRLVASDGVANDSFGASVGVSGDWVAVGAYFKDGATESEGAVYLFKRDQGGAGNWGQFKKIPVPEVGDGFDYFGASLAMDRDTLAVHAANSPRIFIFYRDQGGANNWGLVQTLSFNSSGAISLHNDTLVVGDFSDLSYAGAAYVFYRHQGGSNNWGQVKKLTASDGAADDFFGYSVAVHGDVIVVGASHENSSRGAVYIFYRDQGGANNWGEVVKRTATDQTVDDKYGYDVAVYGDHILVGAPGNDILTNTDQGAVYWLWRNYTGMNAWGQFSRLLLPHGTAEDDFGISVAVWEDQLAIGATYDQTTFTLSRGAAYIFRLMLPKGLFIPLVKK